MNKYNYSERSLKQTKSGTNSCIFNIDLDSKYSDEICRIIIKAKNLFKKKEYLNLFNFINSITISQNDCTIHKLSGSQIINWIFTNSKQIYSTSNIIYDILFEIPSTGLDILSGTDTKIIINTIGDKSPKEFDFELLIQSKKYNPEYYHPTKSILHYWTNTNVIYPHINTATPSVLTFTFENKQSEQISFVQFIINANQLDPMYVKQCSVFKNKKLIKFYKDSGSLFTIDKIMYKYKIIPSKLGTISFDNWVNNNFINASTISLNSGELITIKLVLDPKVHESNSKTVNLWGIYNQTKVVKAYVEHTKKE
jgi:hypothetical protein